MTGQLQTPQASSQFVLSSTAEGCQLIEIFFATAGSSFPFITMSDLTTILKEMRSDLGTHQARLDRAFMDIVSAHAYSANGDPRGEWHYRRSMKNLTPVKLRGADVRSSKCTVTLKDCVAYVIAQSKFCYFWQITSRTTKCLLRAGLIMH
jgi:hypothetical protein